MRIAHASVLFTALVWGVAAAAQPVARPARAAIEKAATDLRPLVFASPADALPKLALLQKDAAKLADRRSRSLAAAAIARLQAEAYLRLGKPQLAEPLVNQSVAQARKLAPGSPLLAELLLTRGGLNIEQLRVAQALADFHGSYNLFQRNGDARSQAKALLNIAFLYLEAKDYASVIKYAQQARQTFDNDPLVLLSAQNNRGLALNELGRHREAEAQFDEALTIVRGMKSPLLEAQVLRNLARTRLLAGKVGEAERTIGEARRVAPASDGPETRAADALAAQIALQQGHVREAERLIGHSFAEIDLAATQLSSREAHETAYRIYAARREDRLALAHLAALKRLDDQATRLATTTSTALMGARFDFANQELKIANLQRDEARRGIALERARAEAQRTLFLGGMGGVAVIVVLLLIGLFTIRRSRDEVRAAAADLTVSNDALGKALAAKTEFLATTSHEIRTPLNGILGMTQVILAGRGVEPTLRDRIQLIHAAGTTMKALVDDILDVAKMETGNLTIEEAPFDPRATLTDAARLWEEQARARGVAFATDLADCPATMIGDAARMRQIVFNLLSNALKFTREGSITLRATQSAEGLTIAVTDTGIGIPADKLDEIFESFRQADAGTTREFGGTGLGLSICRSLAAAMGGRIGVESALGRGSTFTVTLPCRTPARAAVAVAARERAILVVDRNPITRAMLRTLFAPHGTAVGVPDAGEADAWIEGNDALAIVADAATVDRDEQVRLAATMTGKPLILLCIDAADAARRSMPGWRTAARPIAGARLVEMMRSPSVVSASDTLAAQAA